MIVNNKKFKDLTEEWLRSKRYYVKETTFYQYNLNLNKYILPYFKDVKLKKINNKLLYEYIDILTMNNISNRTIKEQLIIIGQILKSNNINIEIPKLKIKYKKINVIDENERLILEKYLTKDVTPCKLGLLLSLYCGLRIGEVCALKWQDIDFSKNTISIDKTMSRVKDNVTDKTKIIITSAKTECGNRVIPIPESLVNIIKKLKSEEEYYVLTNSLKYIEPRTYSNKFKGILRKLNLKDYNYHALRHTFATLCVELGFDAKTLSEILGHSNIKTTLSLYVHINDKIKVNNMNKITINV